MKPLTILSKTLALAATVSLSSISATAATPADADITLRIETKYLHDVTVPPGPIDVETKDGVVTLSGSVKTLFTRGRAQRIAEATRGVSEVVNNLKVIPIFKTDAKLAADIRSALLFDIAVDYYSDVRASVKNGVVTLNGKVESWVEHRRAEQAAKAVRGVREVKNRLVIASKTTRSDNQIMTDVLTALKYDVYLIGDHVYPQVENGKVRLSGKVSSAAKKWRATERAWVRGVKSVDSSGLKVEWSWATKTKGAPTEDDKFVADDDAIRSAINRLFVLNPFVRDGDPEISVKDGRVTLTGTTSTLKGRQEAGREAQEIRGVRRVYNYLKVKPSEAVTDGEVSADIRTAYLRDPYVSLTEIKVGTRDGVVSLTGTVDSYVEKAKAEEVASRINGVLGVRNGLAVSNLAGGFYGIEWDPEMSVGAVIGGKAADDEFKTDAEIQEDIRSAMYWNPFVSSGEVKVRVDRGVATLTGTVDIRSEYKLAEHAAFEGGAVGVRNRLNIN